MGRTLGKLNALKVSRLSAPGMYGDGGGLYLQVTGDGDETISKSWVYRFSLHGRAREMGLGSFGAVSLQDARAKASECRRLRGEGIDPIDARKAARAQAAFEAASALTFKQAANTYIEAHKAGWHNPKHAAQWNATLATYAEPVIGDLSIQAIDTTLVLKVLEPIWRTKPETAN